MRVVIAEDEFLLREGISRILSDEGHEIVATAGDAEDLIGKVGAYRPDLVLTDIRMPPDFTDDGLRAAKRIRQDFPGTAVVVLSQYVDATGAMELLADGANGIGYLLKRRILNLEDFLDSVQRVAAGGSSIDSDVITSMVRREVRDHKDGGIAQLTPRRLEVLQLMAQGYSNARIARELFVTEKAIARSIALIFVSLDLPPDPDDHRRVLAVMRFLDR
ncbi:response regulator transcription factor [Microbacterium azadirachtae]|uniref:Oxygen regulatory protein NreC n=1 Tax=Microbacterium azadirachtae TaxID=582680 RepID=A0A0F0LLC5_9MICO|nr:response regulator transcription factor [Microbacterium azadirachtae]KJL33948.1 Oxygen regulatory protein NreC [Microbacterium azadirachtae]